MVVWIWAENKTLKKATSVMLTVSLFEIRFALELLKPFKPIVSQGGEVEEINYAISLSRRGNVSN